MANDDDLIIETWKSKDLWSERELEHLCCGLAPDASRSSTDELNQAAEAIRRGVLNKSLPCVCPSDATAGDRLYGHARFFRPGEAIAWAAPKFPKFPKFALPEEFPHPNAAGGYPVAPEGLQVGGGTKWPWGDHETELLRKLDAAANRFWRLYDASDSTTAPTNQQVTDWLKTEGVAKRTAEAMATILRADGLPPGPRK